MKREAIEMVAVKSSNVDAVGHSDVTGTLRVRFAGGKEYDYSGVPRSMYFDMTDNKYSAGKYFYHKIRSKYKGTLTKDAV